MSQSIIVTGTDTDVGKTVFAAALTAALDGCYWKPIQAGLGSPTDSETVAHLGCLPADRIVPERYRLSLPASPHIAAVHDGVSIDVNGLTIPYVKRQLIIEAAGGLAVPLTRQMLQIDLLARWKRPVILCARTRLGTINHCLLSIEALKGRAIPILGLAFIGESAPDVETDICTFGGVRRLGRLPHLSPLTPETLTAAFRENFDLANLLGVSGSGP